MRVPKELLHSVSTVPLRAPKRASARAPWAERVTLGEGPSIGTGVGVAAVATWFLSGSLPAPSPTSFAVRPPQSAAHAAVAAAGTGPTQLGLALQPADAAGALRLTQPDVLVVTPARTAAPPRSAVAPRAIPTQARPAPAAAPSPSPTAAPSPGTAPSMADPGVTQ